MDEPSLAPGFASLLHFQPFHLFPHSRTGGWGMKLMVRTLQFVCAAPSSSHFSLAPEWLFLGLQSFRMSLLNVGSLWFVALVIRACSSIGSPWASPFRKCSLYRLQYGYLLRRDSSHRLQENLHSDMWSISFPSFLFGSGVHEAVTCFFLHCLCSVFALS